MVLKPLCAVLWGYVPAKQFSKQIDSDLKLILRPKRIPERYQNGAPNGAKSKAKSEIKQVTSLRSSWHCFVSIFGCFGAHLGLKNSLRPFVSNVSVNTGLIGYQDEKDESSWSSVFILVTRIIRRKAIFPYIFIGFR